MTALVSVNEEIINKLHELSKLSALAGENRFKYGAYVKAAEAIEELDAELTDIEDLESIPGVGSKIACKIKEMLETGDCQKAIKLREEYGDMMVFLQIPGVGPVNARKLYQEYGCRNIEDVRTALQLGRIKSAAIKKGINELSKEYRGRIKWGEAKAIVDYIVGRLSGFGTISRVEACGSFRRRKETVGDIDVIVETDRPDIVHTLCSYLLHPVTAEGEKKVTGFYHGVQVDFRLVPEECFGAAVLYFTGSKKFNIAMRKRAQQKGFKLNEYGLFKGNERVAGITEKSVFKALGEDYVPPQDRE